MAAGRKALSELGKTSAGLTQKVMAKYQGQQLSDSRQEKARDLERRERELSARQDAAPALYERGKDMQRTLHSLRSEVVKRLPSFTALVETCDDFTRYDSRRRAEVAEMAELYRLAGVAMNCPITDAEGRMTEESGRVVTDVEARLRAMETET
ncbi:hypothetical protein ACFYYB_19430 [Streptomyces sp. NPDC002886]|uniref:hypothetical protein n=1 Tax=Streptomyces sp. NPDC002886 TaxID=3364667 RepID=UPI0036B672AC